MRLSAVLRLAAALTAAILVFAFTRWPRRRLQQQRIETEQDHASKARSGMVLAVVACGTDSAAEALNSLKSALMFTVPGEQLEFVIVTEMHLVAVFERELQGWRNTNPNFTYRVRQLAFPSDGNEWRRLFKPCAAQRLFLPDMLPDTDSVLYVDTDTLFMTGVEDVWRHFSHMNGTQMAALAAEHEDANVGWYPRFARHPYYGRLGVNSGVMLMNLTRMRAVGWTRRLVAPVYREYKRRITWGDQDIINIIFHYRPGALYVYSCAYNYRPDHCMYESVCPAAEAGGVRVLHGSRGAFRTRPVFRAVYGAFDAYRLGDDLSTGFFAPLLARLEQTGRESSQDGCARLPPSMFLAVRDNVTTAIAA